MTQNDGMFEVVYKRSHQHWFTNTGCNVCQASAPLFLEQCLLTLSTVTLPPIGPVELAWPNKARQLSGASELRLFTRSCSTHKASVICSYICSVYSTCVYSICLYTLQMMTIKTCGRETPVGLSTCQHTTPHRSFQ